MEPEAEPAADAPSTLSRLLDAVLDLPPESRAGWIDALGPEHAALKPRLRSLLAREAEIESRGFLQSLPALDDPQAGSPSASGTTAGARVGPYSLVRPLGAGGMGTVWLAARADGLFERTVALKLPHRQLLGAGFAERLARERAILAGLDHPNIARLYDAGIGDDGQPYLALEYVDGVPIDAFCRDHGCDVRARLGLLLQVAHAIASAHARLVVHRDLKPANVLVTAAGDVRLLDFGIAKLLDEAAVHDSPLTELAGRALTPDYASPEQILGEPVTTAADVYSLGVLAYELLTGNRPYRLPRATRGALEEAILQAAIVRPSEVAGPYARELRGDLDTILLKALRRAPGDRYASVVAFADDVERHLQHRPILARPASRRYVWGRFVRRNKVAVAAATVATSAVLAGLAVATVGLVRARAAEADALAEAAKAQQVARFVVDLFEVSDPGRARGRTITAREILDSAAKRIDGELAATPAVRATMMATIADVYAKLGLYAEAEPLAAAALEARRARGMPPADLADSLDQAGMLATARGRVDEALVRHAEALALRTAQPSPDVAAIAESIALRGDALMRGTRYRDAVATFREAEQRLAAAPADADRDVATARLTTRLAEAYNLLDDKPRAEELFRSADAIYRRTLGVDHPAVASNLHSLAILLRQTGRLEAAAQALDETLAIQRRALGATHPDVADTLNSRAMLLLSLERHEAALADARQSVALYRAALGEMHNQTNLARVNAARILVRMGRLEPAEAEYRTVLDIRRRTLPPDHDDLAVTLDALAALLNTTGRHAEAASLAREARRIFTRSLGPEHHRTASSEIGLGEALAGLRRHAEAESVLVHACAASAAAGPGRAGQTRACRRRLANVYAATGRPELAAAQLALAAVPAAVTGDPASAKR